MDRCTHQITLTIALVDEITCVRSAGVGQRILGPLVVVGDILFHQSLDIHWVDIVGIQSGTGPENVAEVLDQLMECVEGSLQRERTCLCDRSNGCDRCLLEIRHVEMQVR